MASGEFEFATGGGKLQGKIVWSSTSNGSVANSSNVTAILYARKTVGTQPTHGKEWHGWVHVNGAGVDIHFDSIVYVNRDWVEMARTTQTVGHNANGTRVVGIDGSVTAPTGTSLAGITSSGSQNVTLDNIPRYTSITRFENTGRTSTSITISWQASDACDYGWYSTDNGNTWTGGLSYPNQTISGLSPNTTYDVKIRVRRQDSQLTTDSGAISVKTYANTTPTISLASKKSNQIVVNSSCNVSTSSTQYRIKVSGGNYGNYQSSNTFNGLTPDTNYVVQVRCVGSESGYEGFAETSAIRTYKQTIASISLSSRTSTSITVNSSCNVTASITQYRIKTLNGNWGAYQNGATFSGLTPNTTYTVGVRKVGQESGEEGTAAVNVTTYQATIPYIWIANRTSTSITVGSNCNVATSSVQYRIKAANGNYGSYQNSATFGGLTANTNYVIEVKCVGQESGETGTATCGGTTYQATIPTISLVLKTVDRIDVQSSCNISVKSTNYRIKTSGGAYGALTTATSFRGLQPNTTYIIEVQCIGRENNEMGTSTTTVTTYDIARITSSSNINFGDTISLTKTNPSGTTNELTISTLNPETAIVGRGNIPNEYSFELTDAEWDSFYRKLGTSNSETIRYTLITISPDNRRYLVYSDKTLTLTGTQKTAHIRANNATKRAQVYVGVSGNVKKAVVWVGNNGKKRCI